MPIESFPPPVDAVTTRDELARSLGLESSRSWAGGIVVVTPERKVLVFSDPEEGVKHSYTFDGWAEEEDEYGPVFQYTGAGPLGHQKLSGANSPLMTHRAKGREVHLFVAAGRVPGTSAKYQRYIGQMVLDPIEPYVERWNTDQRGEERMVYVFRLRPAEGAAVAVHEADVVLPAPVTTRLLIPAERTTAAFTTAERHITDRTAVGPQGPRTVYRREGELRTAFADFLTNRGHEVGTYQLTIKGERGTFTTDLYDATAKVLYEAKSASTRKAVREAVAQLLDYRRHIDVPDLRCAVLLPSQPSEDLRDFIAKAGLDLVFRTGDAFTGHLSE
ncbi:hypothetical protein [Kitasatospora terrestris]|uniref:ScoMcrA-like SRA domain-containing protein n=1 Tax=Kitasatospora terrestris TaxID=258051 RepID=A0ABP9DIY0_9ACTN